MARIYVASSWRNEYQPGIVQFLRDKGHAVYDFRNPFFSDSGFSWDQLDPNWKDWNALQYRNRLLTHPTASHGYVSDQRAMEWADTCLCVLPCGRSAHTELGWMAGRGKRTLVLLDDKPEPELMYLLCDHICVSMDEVTQVLDA